VKIAARGPWTLSPGRLSSLANRLPPVPPPEETLMTENAPDPRSADLLARVEAALPIDDLVGWLITTHPGASEREIMGMLQEIYMRDFSINPSGEPEQRYEVGGQAWDAYPQRVAART